MDDGDLTYDGWEGRSATIVAAYLMYSRQLAPDVALELIRTARPQIEYGSIFHPCYLA